MARHVASTFGTAIGQVTPAASRDDTLPMLTAVSLELAGATMTLAATDRYRLAVRDLGWEPAGEHGPHVGGLQRPSRKRAEERRSAADPQCAAALEPALQHCRRPGMEPDGP